MDRKMSTKVCGIVSTSGTKRCHFMDVWEGNRMIWVMKGTMRDRSSKQDLMPHRLRTHGPRAWTAGAAGHLKLTDGISN